MKLSNCHQQTQTRTSSLACTRTQHTPRCLCHFTWWLGWSVTGKRPPWLRHAMVQEIPMPSNMSAKEALQGCSCQGIAARMAREVVVVGTSKSKHHFIHKSGKTSTHSARGRRTLHPQPCADTLAAPQSCWTQSLQGQTEGRGRGGKGERAGDVEKKKEKVTCADSTTGRNMQHVEYEPPMLFPHERTVRPRMASEMPNTRPSVFIKSKKGQ